MPDYEEGTKDGWASVAWPEPEKSDPWYPIDSRGGFLLGAVKAVIPASIAPRLAQLIAEEEAAQEE